MFPRDRPSCMSKGPHTLRMSECVCYFLMQVAASRHGGSAESLSHPLIPLSWR